MVWGRAFSLSTCHGFMDLALVGLGKMGLNMALRLLRGGHRVIVHNRSDGPTGAGHFVKMVHNGIEYGMMQAFAEGFAILDAKSDWGTDAQGEPVEARLDLGHVAEIWREGSVVRSWLLDLTAEALQARPGLGGIAPFVPDSGEGRWTVEAAVDLGVPATALAAALFERFASRRDGFVDRLLSAMRGQFGGHPVHGEAGPDGVFADQIHDDGTIDVVPGGVQTEGATSR